MTRTVLHGGTVFDGTGAAGAPADVLIEGGKIVDVAAQLDGDEGVDVRGKWLLPGFFDCHTHVMFGPQGLNTDHLLDTPFSMRFYEAIDNLEATLSQGITSVRDAAGADLGVKEAVDKGHIRGPRMQISIAMLSQTGGHGDGWTLCGAEVSPLPAYPGVPNAVVDGPDAMRQKVRELIRAGADVIKVATSGGVLSPRDDPRHGHFRDDELEVLVAEATAAGKFVMAHAQATDGIKAAIRTGIRSIEHGIYLDDEAIGMMIDRGTFLVPTLSAPRGVFAARDAGIPVPDVFIREVRDGHRGAHRVDPPSHRRGRQGRDGHRLGRVSTRPELGELALMADCGMSPTDALVATTRTAADLLGVSDQLGTLEPGKRADLVVVDGDPLDLDKLPDRISQVWKDGVCVVDAA